MERILYSQQLVCVILVMLSVSRRGRDGTNTVFTPIVICHTNYDDCLLARSGWNDARSSECQIHCLIFSKVVQQLHGHKN